MAEIKYVIEVDDSQVDKTFDNIDSRVEETTELINKENKRQEEIIDGVGKAYQRTLGDALDAYKQLSPEVQKLNLQLQNFENESREVAAAQKEVNEAFKSGSLNQSKYLEATRALNARQNEAGASVQKFKTQIEQLTHIERQEIGSIAEKTAKLTQLKQQYDNLSEAQRKNASVGGVITKEFQRITAEVKTASAAMSTSNKGIADMLGGLGKVAGALGIAFGTQQVVQFAMEIFDLTKKVEGVSLAFARIGSGAEGLQKLRTATGNLVDDLKLMQLAVDANNFKIPMDTLAKGLEFAQRRAQDTGKEVDYLVDSFVTGLGRKSTMVLDNLGLSIIEIQEEVKKVGDFNIAVGNIIEREMARSGGAVDDLSAKTGRLATIWQNFKISLAKNISGLFSDIDTQNIDNLINKGLEANKGFDKLAADSRKTILAQRKSEMDAAKNLLELNKEARARNEKDNRLTIKEQVAIDDRLEKQASKIREKYEAENTVYNKLLEQNKVLETQERITKGIVSNVEIEAQIAAKRKEANEWVVKDATDRARVNKLLKEADVLQKNLDSRTGKADKSVDKKSQQLAKQAQKELEQDQNKRVSLLQKWADTDTNFLDKQLSRDEQEVKSVKNKYASLLIEIDKYNKDSKAKKIDVSGLKESEEKALIAVRNKQAFDLEQERLDKELAIWSEYEQLKNKIGEDAAKKRFESELNFALTYQQQIEKAIGDLEGKERTGQEDDQLKVLQKRLKAFTDAKRKEETAEYAEAIQAAQTFNDKRLVLDKEYEKQRALLGIGASEEQMAQLEKTYRKAISALSTAELTDSDIWTKLFSNLDEITTRELTTMIDIIERDFDKLKGTFDPIDLAAIRKKLKEAKDIVMKDNPFGQVGVAIKNIMDNAGDDSEEGAQRTKEAWTDLSKSTEKSFDFVKDAINSADFLKDALGEVGNTALQSLMAIATVSITVAAAIKTAEKASVILAIISAALVVVQAIAGLFKSIFAAGDKRLEKSIKSKQNAVEELDRAFQNLERSISDSVGESFYTDSKKQIDNLKEQQALVQSMMEDEQSKKKADAAKLQDYKNEISDIDNQILDIQRNITENLVQTSFKALSDSIASALTSAFEAGEDGVNALNKTFDKFIKDAITNSLKLKLIEPIIADMIDTVSQYMQTNENSLAGFSFDEWREKLGNVGVLFTDSLKDLYQGLGLSTDSTEAAGLSGAIRREMTEATASELTGIYRSAYDLQKRSFDYQLMLGGRQLVFMNDALRVWNNIQVNTANAVNRLDGAIVELKTIARNTGGLNERFG